MKNKLKNMARYTPGLIFILMGLIIVAFPMLLVAFVSAFLVMVGIIATVVAYKTKRLEKEISHMFDGEPLERSFWHRTQEIFCRRPPY
jgi:uncharacterized membrane protein HdeD (DUF308 family)